MEISDAEKEDVQVLFLRFTARSGSAVNPPLPSVLFYLPLPADL